MAVHDIHTSMRDMRDWGRGVQYHSFADLDEVLHDVLEVGDNLAYGFPYEEIKPVFDTRHPSRGYGSGVAVIDELAGFVRGLILSGE